MAWTRWFLPDFIHGQAHHSSSMPTNTIVSSDNKRYTVFHSPGTGSVYALALLAALDVSHDIIEMDFESVTRKEDTPEYQRLLAANPLAQFPTMITPEGTVMTETAAIAFCWVIMNWRGSPTDSLLVDLNDRHAQGTPWSTSSLTPSQLALFYRLMVFIPANIYPVITMIDVSIHLCDNLQKRTH